MNIRTIILVVIVLIVGIIVVRNQLGSKVTAVPTATATYVCSGNMTIAAAYFDGKTKASTSPDVPPTPGGSIVLTLSDGRTMTLPQTLSADGARYANTDESFVFWDKGNSAMVTDTSASTSDVNCIKASPTPAGKDLSRVYANSAAGFSIRLPQDYSVDESYAYQELGPSKTISGIKFTIAMTVATGTNLAPDTYLSVEQIPHAGSCTAALFMEGTTTTTMVDADTTYSVASSTGAGAGNRYNETVYAFPGTSPCVAVRYFIHYGVFQNYPAGMVREFDEQALLSEFDAIRRTLVVVQ